MKQSNNWYLELLFGMRDMMPMSVAAATYGLAFGLLATQSGFNIFQTISMSALVSLMMLNCTMLEWISAVLVLALAAITRKPTFAMFAGMVIIAALRFAIAYRSKQ